MNGKRVVVTGGAGFIGSHLVEQLATDNEVIIIDNLFTGKRDNIELFIDHESLKFIEGDIRDRDLLNDAFQGIDYVFHEAAQVSVPKSFENPVKANDININGTVNVFLAAHTNDVKKVVWASSCAVYGDSDNLPLREDEPPKPLSPYAVTKLAGEYYAQIFTEEYNVPIVSLRYFNVYGPRQDPSGEYAAVIPKFIQRLSDNKPPIIYGDGEQTRDFVFVEDVVQANLKAAERDATGVFNIASGEKTRIRELAACLIDRMDYHSPPVFQSERPGDIRLSYGDISKGRKQLDYEPRYTLEKGIKKYLSRMKNENFAGT